MPILYLKSPHEAIRDKTFEVRPLKVMEALRYLQRENPHYASLEISDDNMGDYELNEDGILQNVPQVDPAQYNIPPEATAASREDTIYDASSTVDFPSRHGEVTDLIRETLQKQSDQSGQQQPRLNQAVPQEQPMNQNLPLPDIIRDHMHSQSTSPRTTSSSSVTLSFKVFWPAALNSAFLHVANTTRDHAGHIETLAFVCGYQDADGNRHATHIIFPVQNDSTDCRVVDEGVNGSDTVAFAMGQLSQQIEGPDRQFCVISWIHSHVKNYPINFSSVDLHMENAFESTLDSRMFGVVFGVDENNPRQRKFDAFVMSSYGKAVVGNCSRTRNLASVQHDTCFHRAFYKSVKKCLVITDSPVYVLDGRNSQPFLKPLSPDHIYAVPIEFPPDEDAELHLLDYRPPQTQQASQHGSIFSQAEELEMEVDSQSQRLEEMNIGGDEAEPRRSGQVESAPVQIDWPARENRDNIYYCGHYLTVRYCLKKSTFNMSQEGREGGHQINCPLFLMLYNCHTRKQHKSQFVHDIFL